MVKHRVQEIPLTPLKDPGVVLVLGQLRVSGYFALSSLLISFMVSWADAAGLMAPLASVTSPSGPGS